MSPSREVCWSQCATARSASCHWPVSRPCTRVLWEPVRVYAGLALEVAEPGVHGLPDHVIDLADQGGPVRVAVVVACLTGQAGVLAQGGVEDRDRLGQRDRQVEEQRALAGLPGGLDPQFGAALGGGVRLGGQQLRGQVGGFAAVARWAAELGAVGSFTLAEQQVIRFALDPLAIVEAQRFWRRGPTSAPAVHLRSRWPGCNSWPRP